METNRKPVRITFLPLQTMDRLHALLLRAISEEPREISVVATAFALPSGVIDKEYRVLESYGFSTLVHEVASLTDLGKRLVSVAEIFDWKDYIEFEASTNDWKVGPGEFISPTMARSMDSIRRRAKQLGFADRKDAVAFLKARNKAEQMLAKFCDSHPREKTKETVVRTKYAEAIVSHLQYAESKDAIAILKEVFDAELARLKACNLESNVIDKLDQIEKDFESQRIQKPFENRRLDEIRAVCETVMISSWLHKTDGSLAASFNEAPALFKFSTDLEFPRTDRKKPKVQVKRTREKTVQPDGLIRSFFRWITG